MKRITYPKATPVETRLHLSWRATTLARKGVWLPPANGTSRSPDYSLTRTVCILFGMLLITVGCGSSDPFSYVKVSGKVSYEDGSPIRAHRVTLTFVPQMGPVEGRFYPRSGWAEANVDDGTFHTVTSHKYGDGIVRGKHKVLVHTYDEQNQPMELVAPAFSDIISTPLLVDTVDTTEFHFVVEKPEGSTGTL